MKKWIKVLLVIIATPILLISLLLVAYVIMNRQGVIEPFAVGNPGSENRILIASQGSEFKEDLVKKLVEEFSNEKTYISVVDCTALDAEQVADWDAIIILNAMQVHKMPKGSRKFLSRMKDCSRILMVCTSGGGDEVVSGFDVDAISSPSRLSNTPLVIEWLTAKMAEKIDPEKLTATGI